MFGGVDNIKLIVLLIFEELRVPHGNNVNLWGYVNDCYFALHNKIIIQFLTELVLSLSALPLIPVYK